MAAAGGAAIGVACQFSQAWLLALCVLALLQQLVATTGGRRASLAVAATGLMAWQLSALWWVALAVRPDGPRAGLWMVAAALITAAVYSLCVLLLFAVSQWATTTRLDGAAAEQSAMLQLITFSLCLLAADELRRHGWTAHGYGGLGIALSGMPGAAGWVPLIGEQGWAAVGVTLAACGGQMFRRLLQGRRAGARAVLFLAGSAAIVMGGGLWLAGHAWTQAAGTPQHVLAVQPRLDKRAVWTEASREAAFAQLRDAVTHAPAGSWVVTPESFFLDAPPAEPEGRWADLLELARERQAHFFLGMPHYAAAEGRMRLMNAVVHLAPGRTSLYAKERLVPGGEFFPWPALLGPLYVAIFDTVDEGQLPSPPELRRPFFASGVFVGVSICHEQSFPALMAERARDAAVLLNLSDDSWIPSALYRQQMMRIARLRAQETGRPLLRVTNGGQTTLLDPKGRVVVAVPDQGSHLLQTALQPVSGETPYARVAGVLAVAPLIAWVGWILMLRRQGRVERRVTTNPEVAR